MSWGRDLWDQSSNVSAHTLHSIELLEKFGRLIRDVSDAQSQFASNLRTVGKKHSSRKKDEEFDRLTRSAAFRDALSEVNDLAGQHEVVVEKLNEVTKEITIVVRELKTDRKRLMSDAEKLQTQLNTQFALLEKTKRGYDKAFKDAERAVDNYRKADQDLSLSRSDLEKVRATTEMKRRNCDDHKTDYGNQLQKFNELQQRHYQELMPHVFDELERLDVRCCGQLQQRLRQLAAVQRGVLTIVSQCFDGIDRAADSIDANKDSRTVIDSYKSGFEPPQDVPFEDLNAPDAVDAGERSGGSSAATAAGANCSTMSAGGGGGDTGTLAARSATIGKRGSVAKSGKKKRVTLFGKFANSNTTTKSFADLSFDDAIKEGIGNLPPNQRRKQVQSRINDLSTKINQETSTREGLTKMKEVYEGNPALGDAAVIVAQLQDNMSRLETLTSERQKFQSYLEGDDDSRVRSQQFYCGGEALSRSESDSSMCQPANSVGRGGPVSNSRSSHIASDSPESGLGLGSRTSLPDSESDADHHQQHHQHQQQQYPAAQRHSSSGVADSHNDYYSDDEEEEEDEVLPVIGETCALYSFDATNEGSISMTEGERLLLIELDQGDGWTRVRRQHSLDEGFVPTTYLQIEQQPDD